MNKLWTWIKSLFATNAIAKATEAAKALTEGLSTDQFGQIVDEVVSIAGSKNAAGEPLPGLEKAALIEVLLSSPEIVNAYKFPPWVTDGFNALSTIVKLAWTVARLSKRI